MKRLRLSRAIPSAWISTIFLAAAFAASCGKDVERRFADIGGTVVSPSTDESSKGGSGDSGQNGGDISTMEQVDEYVQPQAEVRPIKTDILVIMDTSTSMDVERPFITQGIASFFLNIPEGVDFRVGLLAAHSQYWSGRLFHTADHPMVQDSLVHTREEIAAAFQAKVEALPREDFTDGGEAGLYTLWRVLHPVPWINARTAGFFRRDAALIVIFASDENAICSRHLEGIEFVEDPDGREIPAFEALCLDEDGNPLFTHETILADLLEHKEGMPLAMSAVIYLGSEGIPQGGEKEIG